MAWYRAFTICPADSANNCHNELLKYLLWTLILYEYFICFIDTPILQYVIILEIFKHFSLLNRNL